MMGRNIQYFLRMAAIALSCSLRSERNRAVPSNFSPPIDSLTFGLIDANRLGAFPFLVVIADATGVDLFAFLA